MRRCSTGSSCVHLCAPISCAFSRPLYNCCAVCWRTCASPTFTGARSSCCCSSRHSSTPTIARARPLHSRARCSSCASRRRESFEKRSRSPHGIRSSTCRASRRIRSSPHNCLSHFDWRAFARMCIFSYFSLYFLIVSPFQTDLFVLIQDT